MKVSSLNIVTPGCSIPPNGNAGASMYWNCWYGYGTPKYFSRDTSAVATCVCSESTSTSAARDARTQSVVDRGPPVKLFHGPAAKANKYVGNGSDSRNRYVANPAAVS